MLFLIMITSQEITRNIIVQEHYITRNYHLRLIYVVMKYGVISHGVKWKMEMSNLYATQFALREQQLQLSFQADLCCNEMC